MGSCEQIYKTNLMNHNLLNLLFKFPGLKKIYIVLIYFTKWERQWIS